MYKKIIFFISICFLIFIGGFAQNIWLGPKIGLNIASQTRSIEYADAKSNFVFGYHTGLVFDIGGGDVFTLQPEILFSFKGHQYELANNQYHKLNSNYLEIPFLAKISYKNRMVKTRHDVTGYGNIGGYMGYWLSATETYTNDTIENHTADLVLNNEYNSRFDYGLIIGGGVSYKTQIGRLFIEMRYHFGLGDINVPILEPLDYKKTMNRTIVVSVGVMVGAETKSKKRLNIMF